MSNAVITAKELFLAAIELDSLEQQAAYLQLSCSANAQLRAEVEALIHAHASPNPVFDHPPIRLCPQDILAASAASQVVGRTIDRYVVKEVLGEGGMGIVYVAEQLEPIKRMVALKIIKPGMDSKAVLTRFEAERQVLALLDHPNIARILDAGRSGELGSEYPFFAMELVCGVPITEYCDQACLLPRQRLELFVTVCQAVQHAHQKGIIHRDLKPNNILIGVRDGAPVVKVIDFGIAKALNQKLTEDSLNTGITQLVGTPLYMSPEQAEFGSLDIDTRSDIYSLGVLLYELLTGQLPFDHIVLETQGLEGTRRWIMEVDPPLPSHRVSTLKAELATTISHRRGLDRPRLKAVLKGELDWIVMKSLEKDRNRRYDSTGAFAADVQRFLNDEPVLAGPPSASYRLRKLAWRHRHKLATISTVAVTLVVATCLATWQAIAAHRARRDSLLRLEREIAAHSTAEKERRRAEANVVRAEQLLYASDLQLAGNAGQRGDFNRVRSHLERHIPADGQPDVRGFEWHYLWEQASLGLRDPRPANRELLQIADALYFVCMSPDGKMLAATGKSSIVYLFGGQDLRPTGTLDTHQIESNGLAFSPDSHTLASVGDDGTVALWDVETLRERLRFKAHDVHAFQVAFSPDGKSLVTCGRESVVRLWDPTTGASQGVLDHHERDVESLTMSSLGHVATTSRDGTTDIWDVKTKTLLNSVANWHWEVGSAVAFSSAGHMLVAGQLDGTLALWNNKWQPIRGNRVSDPVQCVAFSPRAIRPSNWIAAGDRGGNISLLRADPTATRRGADMTFPDVSQPRRWAAHSGRVYSVCFTPDGKNLVSAGSDGRLRLWELDLVDSRRALQINVPSAVIAGNAHVVLGNAGMARIPLTLNGANKQLDTQKRPGWKLLRYADRHQTIYALAHDGKSMIALRATGMIRKWKWTAPTGEHGRDFVVTPDAQVLAILVVAGDQLYLEIQHLGQRHRVPVEDKTSCIALSDDGRKLAVGRVGRIEIIDTKSGETVRVLERQPHHVLQMDISPDGNYLASVSKESLLVVWDLNTGAEIWSEVSHEVTSHCVQFSPDGRTIVTSGADLMLRFWRWEVGRLACEFPIGQSLTSCLQFSPDGQKLLVVHPNSSAVIFDASH